jgi:hypothetical protein
MHANVFKGMNVHPTEPLPIRRSKISKEEAQVFTGGVVDFCFKI